MALSPEELEQKQKELLEKARRGVLKFVQEKGGTASLADMHDFSMNRYLIQHQAFSQLMETMVDQKLVDYDFANSQATLTDAGRQLIAGS